MKVRDFGEVTVRYEQDDNGRTIVCSYFGDDFDPRRRQTAMFDDDPNALYLWYAKACMAYKLFKANPKKILIVGLGSGTLTKYLYHNTDAHIVSVEISQDMIDASKECFYVVEDARSEIVCMDAADYVKQTAGEEFDLVFLDGFGSASAELSDLIPVLNTAEFYGHTRRILKKKGICVVNMLLQKKAVYHLIDRVYQGHTFRITQMYQGNQVCLSFKDAQSWLWDDLNSKAEALREKEPEINFPLFLKAVVRNGAKTTNIRLSV